MPAWSCPPRRRPASTAPGSSRRTAAAAVPRPRAPARAARSAAISAGLSAFRNLPDRLSHRAGDKAGRGPAGLRSQVSGRITISASSPFGAVDRHHPDALTLAVKLALHLDIVGLHPDEEPGQAGHLVRSHTPAPDAEKLVDPVLGLGPQAASRAACAARRGGGGRVRSGHRAAGNRPGRACRPGNRGSASWSGCRPREALPTDSPCGHGPAGKARLRPPAEGRPQDRRQRQVVLGRVEKGQQRGERSLTASSPPSFSRSAPAIGRSSALQARMIS